MRRSVRLVTVAVAALLPVLVFAGPAQAAMTAALYHMSDPSVLVDSSGNGNNGTTTAITSVPGTAGRGYHFNGQNSVAVVPDSASLNPGTQNFRVTLRARFTVVPSAAVGDYDLIRKGLAGTIGGEWKMEILPAAGNTVGNAFCHFQDAATVKADARSTRNLADGAWHTIACVKTASAVKVVVDGVTTSVPAQLGSISNNKAMGIGAKVEGGDQYLGDLDEVNIQVG